MNIVVETTVPIRKTIVPVEFGKAFAEGSADAQLSFLLGFSDTAQTYNWESQANFIAREAEKMPPVAIKKLVENLETLVFMLKAGYDEELAVEADDCGCEEHQLPLNEIPSSILYKYYQVSVSARFGIKRDLDLDGMQDCSNLSASEVGLIIENGLTQRFSDLVLTAHKELHG